jgi:hypothetical protein
MMSDSQGQMDDEPIVAIACEFPVRFDAASDQTALRFQHTKPGPPVSLAMRFIGWRAAFVDLVALRRQKERERQAENGSGIKRRHRIADLASGKKLDGKS